MQALKIQAHSQSKIVNQGVFSSWLASSKDTGMCEVGYCKPNCEPGGVEQLSEVSRQASQVQLSRLGA